MFGRGNEPTVQEFENIIQNRFYPACFNKLNGSITYETMVSQIGELRVAQYYNTVEINFFAKFDKQYTDGVLGRISGVQYPQQNIRSHQGGGADPYNTHIPIYCILDTTGEIRWSAPSAVNCINVHITYIVD